MPKATGTKTGYNRGEQIQEGGGREKWVPVAIRGGQAIQTLPQPPRGRQRCERWLCDDGKHGLAGRDNASRSVDAHGGVLSRQVQRVVGMRLDNTCASMRVGLLVPNPRLSRFGRLGSMRNQPVGLRISRAALLEPFDADEIWSLNPVI